MVHLHTQDEELSPLTLKALDAISGYLYFNLDKFALTEIENITEYELNKFRVLEARIQIFTHQKKWQEANKLCRFALKCYEDNEVFISQLAFILYQEQRTAEAEEVINDAPEWIKATGVLHYNFGCYAARIGDIRTARISIRTAIHLNAAMRISFRTDEDLTPLRNEKILITVPY